MKRYVFFACCLQTTLCSAGGSDEVLVKTIFERLPYSSLTRTACTDKQAQQHGEIKTHCTFLAYRLYQHMLGQNSDAVVKEQVTSLCSYLYLSPEREIKHVQNTFKAEKP